jgi:methylmalonyl-CoA mutase N-terminal domain/subunit
MNALERGARSNENLVPMIIDAVLAWATVGEIAGRLRTVFGEHQETLVL